MWKNLKKLIVIIIALLSISLVACNKINSDKETIVISVSNKQMVQLQKMVDSFNKKCDEYNVVFEMNELEQVKNYKIEHKESKGDIYVFDSYIEANNMSDYLMDLRTKEFVNNYQVNIINYLKTFKGELYVIPSVGKFYSNCYNINLMNNYNYSVPSTLQELIVLAQRNEIKLDGKKYFKTSSTVGGEDSLKLALMQVAFPHYLGTTEGNFFLKQFITGQVKMSSEEYKNYFYTILKNLLLMYDLKFYSLDDINQSMEEGLVEFDEEQTIIIQSSAEYPFDKDLESMNCYFTPFLGTESDIKWVASKPMYYFGVAKNLNSNMQDGVNAFLEYCSSVEGQSLLMSYDGRRNESNNNYVSYLKEGLIELDEAYRAIENEIKTGRVFLTDLYEYIFEKNVDSIIQYIKKEITVEELLDNFDNKMASPTTNQRTKISSTGSFDYDSKRIGQEETLIANYISDAVNKEMGSIDAVCLSSSIVKANIYKDGIYLDELSVIINDSEIAYTKIKVSDLKNIISELIKIEEMPMISGIRLSYNGNVLKLYNTNKRELKDEEYINITIDTSLITDYSNISLGKKYSVVNVLTKYLQSVEKIIVPKYDGRYGD